MKIDEKGYDLNKILAKQETDCKKYIGVSPHDYIQIKQLVTATNTLLNEKNETLTWVGNHSEYYDQSHFIRRFKRALKETPKQFVVKGQALKSKIIKK